MPGPALYSADMRFAPEYVANVLNENFEDAKHLFLAPLLAIHHAHLVMLAAEGIISSEDAHRLRLALDEIDQARPPGDQVRRHAARICSSTSSA